MIKDMTEGNEAKLMILFSLPLLAGNIFQQLYNLVDTIVVGQFVGSDAFAAVGTSMPIMFLILALVMGLSMGASILISQLFGAQKDKEVKRAISTSIIFIVISAIFLSIVGLIISKPILKLLNTPENILQDAAGYMKIIFGGMIFMFIYNMFAYIFRALGDSKSPLYFLIIASILNVFLDLLFVIEFKMGIPGVAYATLISQAVSSVLCVLYIYKKDIKILKFKPSEFVFDRKLFIKIIRLGIPSSAQQTVLSIGFLAVQGLVNSFGDITMSAFFAASRIEQVVTLPNMTLSMAMSTFTGQNIGAGRIDRVKRGYGYMVIVLIGLTVITGSIMLLFGPSLIRIFIKDGNAEIIRQGNEYLKTVSYFLVPFGGMFLTNGLLRGAGDVNISSLSTIFVFAVRLITAYTLAPKIGPSAIWYSLPVGWIVGLTIAVIRYFAGGWQKKAVVNTL